LSNLNITFISQLSTIFVPNNVQEALLTPGGRMLWMERCEILAKKWNVGISRLYNWKETNRMLMGIYYEI